MAIPVWPLALPQCVIPATEEEGLPDGRLSQEMDAGPAKVRRASSAMPWPFSGQIRVDAAGRAAIRAFWVNDLQCGALPFLFPAQGGEAGSWLVRFTGDPPTLKRETPKRRVITLQLEVLP